MPGVARADAVGRPRREEVTPRRPPRVERRQAPDERQVRRDEVARADQPQDTPPATTTAAWERNEVRKRDGRPRHFDRRRSRGSRRTPRPRRSARGEADAVDVVVRRPRQLGFGRQDARERGRGRRAASVRKKRFSRLAPPTWRRAQLGVREDLTLVTLAAAFADPPPMVRAATATNRRSRPRGRDLDRAARGRTP